MKVQFSTGSLVLFRYPEQNRDPNLQAWDAADEYLLKELDLNRLQKGRVLIVNDSFGALTCALHAYQPTVVSDSYVSQSAIQHNLKANQLASELVTFCHDLTQLSFTPTVILIKVPKTLAQLEWQLAALSTQLAADTLIVAGAKVRDIHTSTLKLFANYVGETQTTLAWKKARLILSHVAESRKQQLPEITHWALHETTYQLYNYAGVFSQESLDIGARFFLQHLPADLQGKVADLGCGNGVLGMMLLQVNPRIELLFCDESYAAIRSSQDNIHHNMPEELTRCTFLWGDCLASVAANSLQTVVCNPPFHQQHTITDHIAKQMFVDAKRCLQVGGELRIIGNRHLGYQLLLRKLFGNCQTVATNHKFVILSAIKRGK